MFLLSWLAYTTHAKWKRSRCAAPEGFLNFDHARCFMQLLGPFGFDCTAIKVSETQRCDPPRHVEDNVHPSRPYRNISFHYARRCLHFYPFLADSGEEWGETSQRMSTCVRSPGAGEIRSHGCQLHGPSHCELRLRLGPRNAKSREINEKSTWNQLGLTIWGAELSCWCRFVDSLLNELAAVALAVLDKRVLERTNETRPAFAYCRSMLFLSKSNQQTKGRSAP
jgi:hypothetical protein